jgi:UDP-glucose 4-epimerase
LLRLKRVPYLIGFNPMMQFIHESDLRDAVLKAFLSDDVGVFNVTGAGAMPYRTALGFSNATQIPLPSTWAKTYVRAFSRFQRGFPLYLIEFLKYPCVISDERFRAAFGWAPEMGMVETIQSTVMSS